MTIAAVMALLGIDVGRVGIDEAVLALGGTYDLAGISVFELGLQIRRLSSCIRSIITLRCEDAIYLLRKNVQNQQLTNATVVEIAEQVVSEVTQILEVVAGKGLSDIKFDEFNIVDATAWGVLKKLKEQGGITAYVRGERLYLSLRYLQDESTQREVVYDFARNVEQSNLKYVRAEERKVHVKVIGIGKDNKRHEATAGRWTRTILRVTTSGSYATMSASISLNGGTSAHKMKGIAAQ